MTPAPAPAQTPARAAYLAGRFGQALALAAPDELDDLRADVADLLDQLDDEAAEAVLYDFGVWARDAQLPPPGAWTTWALLGGRGSGKTRSAAEWIRAQVEAGRRRLAIVAATAADCRDTCIEGESGLLKVLPPWMGARHQSSLRRISFPNGAIVQLFSADEPDRLRGPNHEAAWADELCAWRRPEAWDLLRLAVRIGRQPQIVVSTTPRPTRQLKTILADPATAVSRMSTFDNKHNLAPAFFAEVVSRYAGTRYERQEIFGHVIEDVEGSLFPMSAIEGARVPRDARRDLTRIVVGVDPAVSAGDSSDETGIVVCGVDKDKVFYVLDDVSLRAPPDAWARAVVAAYEKWEADSIVVEVNQGGDLCESVLRQVSATLPIRKVHAARGKVARAEPVSALLDQGRLKFVGSFPKLEDQLGCYVPGGVVGPSPDRGDAMVWSITALLGGGPIVQPSAMVITGGPSMERPDWLKYVNG